ncbi:adenosine receptor A3-like [Gigantopelta aegis]|uniref:adenosine receptor A3-like n=1 Tax=Gigantopelta aegis TaxID=1735272 RepID=UPI001B8885D3|nr:adenosine receptor A3-like [Gigantopelta aegis]
MSFNDSWYYYLYGADGLEAEANKFKTIGYWMISVCLLIMLFICLGNLMTIVAVWLTPALRTIPNMYVVSLAVADFLTGAIIPYFVLIWSPSFREALHENEQLCLFRMVLYLAFVVNSILCIVAIAFDRFLFIRFPLHYEMISSKEKAMVIIPVMWLSSAAFGSVPLFYNSFEEEGCSYLVVPLNYYLFALFPLFLICSVLTAGFYGYIVITASWHSRRRRSTTTRWYHSTEWKSVKMFVVVFGVFFACWIPCFIIVIIIYLDSKGELEIDYWTSNNFQFSVIPGFLNSGMNFLIYAYQNLQFRHAFAKLLRIRRRQTELMPFMAPNRRPRRSVVTDFNIPEGTNRGRSQGEETINDITVIDEDKNGTTLTEESRRSTGLTEESRRGSGLTEESRRGSGLTEESRSGTGLTEQEKNGTRSTTRRE